MDNNYQNTQNNYYQNLYNMFGTNNPLLDKEASEIRRLGINAGTACLGFIILQYVYVFILRILGLSWVAARDVIYGYGLGALGQVLYVFVPFFILFLTSSEKEKSRIMKFDKPKNTKMYILSLFIGFGACMLLNFFSNILLGAFSVVGIDFLSGTENVPVAETPLEYLVTILGVAIVAPMLEEFAFRGVLLQPLRKYGDKFAIFTSSLIFGIMHGNMVQAPMAIAAGMVMAYLCIKTESIWTSISIHILNNLSACILDFYYNKNPDAPEFPSAVILSAFISMGAVAVPVFFKMNKKKLSKGKSAIDNKQKHNIYLCVPTVLLAVIHCIYSTINLQQTTTSLGGFIIAALLIVFAVFTIKRINAVQNDSRITPNRVYSISKVMVILSTIFFIVTLFALNIVSKIAVTR